MSTDIRNQYWSVQDSSPGTQVWNGSTGAFVPLADTTYVAWAVAGNSPVIIATMADLLVTINNFNQSLWAYTKTYKSQTITGNIELTNPVASWYDITNNTSDGLRLTFPQANIPGSLPIGSPIYFRNTGSKTFSLRRSDLTSVGGIIYPQSTALITLAANTTSAGTWNCNIIEFMDSAAGTANTITYFDGTQFAATNSAANGIVTTNSTSKPGVVVGPAIDYRFPVSLTAGGVSWSDYAFPTAVGTSGTLLRSDGSNFVHSSSTFPDTSVNGQVLIGNGTNWNAVSGWPVTLGGYATGIDLNALGDTSIAITTPGTKYRIFVFTVYNTGTTASLTTAQFGLFSQAAGAGQALIASGTALSGITQNTIDSTGNQVSFNAVQTIVDYATVYFRVTQVQGAASTANVYLWIQPIP